MEKRAKLEILIAAMTRLADSRRWSNSCCGCAPGNMVELTGEKDRFGYDSTGDSFFKVAEDALKKVEELSRPSCSDPFHSVSSISSLAYFKCPSCGSSK